jgi:uncharacterized protein (UPF0261 family)/ABC-type branched-subunit amino acid transport system ATPase component
MAERFSAPPAIGTPILQVSGLNVFYGRSHALQGVDLTLGGGVLSVVGRNGMGKTTLCKTIMGLVPASSGSVRFFGEEILGRPSTEIARLGLGYVPQGRRLWRSLTVDEHLKLMQGSKRGAWSIERIYDTFPRLAERKGNGGGQLSGGEQQMLAISRALLMNPRLLIMDEPTEGLAPVIVAQVETMLVQIAAAGDVSILVIEQNIGVATQIAENVAIMVNGRVNRVIDSATIAADRDLQQRLLGVGRHGHDETDGTPETPASGRPQVATDAASTAAPNRVFMSNPALPTRWSQPVPAKQIEAQARTMTRPTLATVDGRRIGEESSMVRAIGGEPFVVVAGTLDTKGEELRYIRDIIKEAGVRVKLVDLSTTSRSAGADVTPQEVALHHPRGVTALASGDRGAAVAAMAQAFEAWTRRQTNILGMISAAGSGGTAMATPAMQALPVGVPKLMISTMASGNTRQYVGPTDIAMMYSITDVSGLNRISREVLANGAQAIVGMARARGERLKQAPAARRAAAADKPVMGMTMFGVTTTAVQQLQKQLEGEWECLIFHATGIGGQSMEKLIDSGMMTGVIDLTTTEICDMMMGGVLPATEDRFGAVIRTKLPYIGSVGALDMVNFAAPDTVPAHYRSRLFYEHNPQITLMRTTLDENVKMAEWIGERLNRMEGQVRFFLPEGGVSALDAAGKPFDDSRTREALFTTLEKVVRQTPNRQLIRLPHNINDPAFTSAVAASFRSLHVGRVRRPAGRTGQ